mmetsp:Transcript_7104/g.10462  ORF Transcript_7104/g.10462 Transcript_7104/m.10462 type:complete len:89 (-) Transcript_7104:4-270(-)
MHALNFCLLNYLLQNKVGFIWDKITKVISEPYERRAADKDNDSNNMQAETLKYQQIPYIYAYGCTLLPFIASFSQVLGKKNVVTCNVR